jgi:hypothetical protein
MELALICRDQTQRADAFIMIGTAAACLALNNVALGFALGLAAAWLVRCGVARLDA